MNIKITLSTNEIFTNITVPENYDFDRDICNLIPELKEELAKNILNGTTAVNVKIEKDWEVKIMTMREKQNISTIEREIAVIVDTLSRTTDVTSPQYYGSVKTLIQLEEVLKRMKELYE